MSIATIIKPHLRAETRCESCRNSMAIVKQTLPDGVQFLLCQSCLTPVAGSKSVLLSR